MYRAFLNENKFPHSGIKKQLPAICDYRPKAAFCVISLRGILLLLQNDSRRTVNCRNLHSVCSLWQCLDVHRLIASGFGAEHQLPFSVEHLHGCSAGVADEYFVSSRVRV